MNKKYLMIMTALGFIVSISKAAGSEDKINQLATEYEEKFYQKQEHEERKKSKQLATKGTQKNKKGSQPNSPLLSPSSPVQKVKTPLQKPAPTTESKKNTPL